MRLQVFFASLLLFLVGADVFGDEKKACFNFNQKIMSPLHARIAFGATASGKLGKNVYWAAVRGESKAPLQAVLKDLLAHDSTKSGRISKMRITPLEDPQYFSRQLVGFQVDPFPLVTITWEEDWAFTLLKGEIAHPQSVLASYEKTAGTSHISHLCGNIWIEPLSPTTSDVYLYEEAEATGRTEEDTLKGLKSTLKNLGKVEGVPQGPR